MNSISSVKPTHSQNQEESLFGAPFMFDLEDELNGEDGDKHCSFMDSASQSNHIKNTLLNMMDEEPAETAQFVDPQVKPAVSSQQKEAPDVSSQQLIDHIVNAI